MLQSYARILVVDDSETTRKLLRGVLYKLGYTNVREAPHGAKALEMLETQAFGLIISDWQMEPVDGLQLLQAVRASAQWRSLPFIMITGAHTKPTYAEIARDNGATFFLPKPFTIDVLRQRIAALGANSRAA